MKAYTFYSELGGEIILNIPDDYKKHHLPKLKEWVAALRGGAYKQGMNHLCFDGKYCCLGVLCEITKVKGAYYTDGNAFRYFYGRKDTISKENPYYQYLGREGFIPECVVITGKKIFTSLASLNDEARLSFDQIADIIELLWEDTELK